MKVSYMEKVESYDDCYRFFMFKKRKEFTNRYIVKVMQELNIPDGRVIKACGYFVNVAECRSCKTRHFVGYYRCKNRFCLNCAHVRVLAYIKFLVPYLYKLVEEGYYINKVNLTVENTERLKEGLNVISKAYRNLLSSRKTREEFKRRFVGGLRSLEVKRGERSGLWHPHYHMIVIKDEYSEDYDWLKESWKYHVRKLGYEGSVWLKGMEGFNIVKELLEAIKYIIKPAIVLYENKDDFWEVYINLKGKKQIDRFGILRSVKIDEDVVDEEEIVNFVCKVCGYKKADLIGLLYEDVKNSRLYDL